MEKWWLGSKVKLRWTLRTVSCLWPSIMEEILIYSTSASQLTVLLCTTAVRPRFSYLLVSLISSVINPLQEA